jgi:hypothetical protein
MASPEWEYWITGTCDELCSLVDLHVFVLVPHSELPKGKQPLRGKLVYKHKHDNTGKIICYKVRYVTKGFAQRQGINYDKTSAPTACLESFQAIAHLGAALNWDLYQFDIKTAFLHGILPVKETAYIEQPFSFKVLGKED